MNGTKHLNLQHDAVLPSFAFNLNLRPCSEALAELPHRRDPHRRGSPCGQGLTLAHFRAQLEDRREHIAHVRAQLEHPGETSTG